MRRMLEPLLLLPLTRIVLAVAGLAGVTAGAIIAWDARAATPLLIVSAVFVVLGLFDWTELTARHGESSLTLSRAVRQIQQVAARDDVPAQARQQLEDAARDISWVGRAETRAYWDRRPATPSPNVTIEKEGDRLLFTFEPTAKPPKRGTPTTIRCEVITPGEYGKSFFSNGQPWGRSVFTYPDDFPNASPLREGEYIIIWRAEFDSGDMIELSESRVYNRT